MLIFFLLLSGLNPAHASPACVNVTRVLPKTFRLHETVLYLEKVVNVGRGGFASESTLRKLGEVTGFLQDGKLKVTPWDYPDRYSPGMVLDTNGQPTDGSRMMDPKDVYHRVSCLIDHGVRIYPGAVYSVRIGARQHPRHSMLLFEQGYGMFLIDDSQEAVFQREGLKLFTTDVAPVMISRVAGSSN